jgi:GTPase SAR1 family protein
MKEAQFDDTEVLYNLWDTSSTELELKILPSQIYKTASCFFICCSYDNLQSINNIPNWIDHIKRYSVAQNGSLCLKIPIVILFNKCDVTTKAFRVRDIRSKLIKITEQYEEDSIYIVEKVSAKDDLNLKNIFKAIVEYGFSGYVKAEDFIYSTLNLSPQKSTRRSFRLDSSILTINQQKKKAKCCN